MCNAKVWVLIQTNDDGEVSLALYASRHALEQGVIDDAYDLWEQDCGVEIAGGVPPKNFEEAVQYFYDSVEVTLTVEEKVIIA